MTEHEIVRTVLALTNFHPPDGVDYLVVLAPRPGNCRVAAAFTIRGQKTHHIELTEPPSETTLLALYRYAESVRDARGSVGMGGSAVTPNGDQSHWAYTVGIDLNRIGGD